jgi:hypothetical protein
MLPACTAAGTQPAGGQSADTGLAGPVSYEVSSWGRLLTHWRIDPDGTGEIWRGDGFGKGNGAVRKYRLRMDQSALSTFTRLADELRESTRKEIPCTRQITDMPYGAVIWHIPGAQQTYRFDGGCRSPEADAVADQIRTVHDVVNTMATIDAEPYITENPDQR